MAKMNNEADDEKDVNPVFCFNFFGDFPEHGDGGRSRGSDKHTRLFRLRVQAKDKFYP